MNIAFFSKHLPSDKPGGVSVQVHRLAEALSKRSHRITVFSFSPRPPAAAYDHILLKESALRSRIGKKFAPAFAFRNVGTAPFDICHYHGDDYLCGGSVKRIRTFYGSALFEAIHAVQPPRRLYQLLFYSFEWLSCMKKGSLVAISAATTRALPLVKHVIPCGVPLDRFKPGGEKSGHPTILFIGDFKSRKQGDLLLAAFSGRVLHAFPSAELIVVGPGKTSSPNVTCLGTVSEDRLIEEYQKAWVYCLPSSYEGFGVPAIEAMAIGTPLVAVENSGTREVIEHGETGLLCSQHELGKNLVALLENSDLRRRLANCGIKKAQEYDIARIAAQYETVYARQGSRTIPVTPD